MPAVPLGPPMAPVFLGQLEMRPIGGFPGAGAEDPTTEGWVSVRPGDVTDLLDREAYVAALVDAWWPSAMVRFPGPRAVATVGFALDLPSPAGPDDVASPDGSGVPLLHRGRLLAARDGYVTETRELWSEAGRLLAWNTQTMAVIR